MDIIVEKVTKLYGAQKAVDNISFKVNTGEVLGFLGPNGAGKTTTMKAITCFLAPSEGDITVGGLSVRENPEKVKSLIGYLPENNPLYQEMQVIDYLAFVAELQGVPKEQIPGRIREMIRVCGLSGEKSKNIRELSKGYKQRVGLAQALIHDPEVLVLDEPTTGLDPNQIAEIRDLIRKIGKEKTVILSSHILAEVEATCDRILIISNGRIVANGTPAELRMRAHGDEILKVKIGGGEAEDIFIALEDLETVRSIAIMDNSPGYFEVHSHENENSARPIFEMCAENNWYIEELTPVETRLEDIFREVTMN